MGKRKHQGEHQGNHKSGLAPHRARSFGVRVQWSVAGAEISRFGWPLVPPTVGFVRLFLHHMIMATGNQSSHSGAPTVDANYALFRSARSEWTKAAGQVGRCRAGFVVKRLNGRRSQGGHGLQVLGARKIGATALHVVRTGRATFVASRNRR